jgi:nitric oxide reductase activation protein
VGSGLALLSVATVICDLLVLYVLPNKAFYNKVKFEEVGEKEPSDDEDPREDQDTIAVRDGDSDTNDSGSRASERSPLIAARIEF